ncbi:SDR family NAD(P)-dependent oxidoreductase [Aestuariivirga sp.]|uniref:SDR family NAD(P)-dependent oxidoreductase n=1 Tax=Aestuariivirga sp. TaxID=2650926 RepID=UPI003BAA92A2
MTEGKAIAFSGKRVIITGAGRGLGAALAVVLADKGADLLLTGRSRENLSGLAESILHRTGRKPQVHLLDMADVSAVTLFAKQLRDEGRPLDILINNAAQWLPGRMTDHDALAISQTIAANVTGTMLLTRGLIPLLEKSGAGDIMTIVSTSGLPNARLRTASVAFTVSKQAQSAMSDGLRQELKGGQVRVQAVFPPDIQDLSPLDPAWDVARDAGSAVTNRDVVETIIFALERPRHVTLASIIFDADTGELH